MTGKASHLWSIRAEIQVMAHPRFLGSTHNSHQAREQNFPTWGLQIPSSPQVGSGGIRMSWDWGAVPFVGGCHQMTPLGLLCPSHSLSTDASIRCRTAHPCSYPNSSTVIFSLVWGAILLTYYLNNSWKGITFRECAGMNHGYPGSPRLTPLKLSSDAQKGP